MNLRPSLLQTANRLRANKWIDYLFLLFAAIGLTLLTVWFIDRGANQISYTWQWSQVPDYIAFYEEGQWWPAELLQGLQVTLKLTALSLIGAITLGLVIVCLRLSNAPLCRLFARSYIEVVRNTPILIQIYLLYFIVSPIFSLERTTTAIIALSFFQGAYTAEIFRAGLQTIPKGQREAAQSLGLSPLLTFYRIILPQLIQRTLPALTNEMINLLKNSSIVSVIAVFDLTTQGRNIVSDTAMPFEIWFTVAFFYLGLILLLSTLSSWLEKRSPLYRSH